jgi:hypothetical protein
LSLEELARIRNKLEIESGEPKQVFGLLAGKASFSTPHGFKISDDGSNCI